MVRQACESARAWRGGHTAGQIEVSVRSRTFRLQIAAMRRNKQLSEPAPPISRLLGDACALI
jgi:hypothetical protein